MAGVRGLLRVIPTEHPEGPSPPGPELREIDTGGVGLRRFAAHGAIVNSLFDLGIGGVNLLRGGVLAILLSRADFGLWGILLASLGVLAQLKLIGISDAFIQQNEADQALAFQRAFSLDLATGVLTMGVLAALVPAIAAIYGRPALILPGLVLCTMLPAYAFQSPQWIFYRRMDFLRQRWLTAVEPLVGLVVAIVLALLGAGVWALVAGALAGAWAGAVAAVATSPYRLAWRLDRRTVSVYRGFSGPILIATLTNVLLANGTMLATDLHLGLRAVGALALTTTILAFTTRVDDVIATTVYPGICAVADRLELLRESFTKTNRLAMLWAVPFGVALTLFAPELVRNVLGEKWHAAVPLLQITGVVAAVDHIGFNWDDYYRARADTRPIAWVALASVLVTLGSGIPLLWAAGLPGLAWGIAAGAGAALIVRTHFIARLFRGYHPLWHSWRALAPSLLGAALILGVRALGPGHGPAVAAGELLLYLLCVAALSAVSERTLLGEAFGYLRRRPPH